MTPDHHAGDLPSLPCAVVTISDTRSERDDVSGRRIQDLLVGAGHTVAAYTIIPDDEHHIRLYTQRLAENATCQVALFSGGTGVAPRDTTVEALSALITKQIPGFGELFRALSFQEIGPKAMLTRAIAGTYNRLLLFAMPGSPAAVELAMNRLILPAMPHAAAVIRGA